MTKEEFLLTISDSMSIPFMNTLEYSGGGDYHSAVSGSCVIIYSKPRGTWEVSVGTAFKTVENSTFRGCMREYYWWANPYVHTAMAFMPERTV